MKLRSFVVVLPLLSCAFYSVVAQSRIADTSDLTIENVQVLMEVENIQVSFLVRDTRGNLIRNLSATDFVILENGKQQPIVALKEQEVPINAVVMLDTSYSLSYFLQDALGTALKFFNGLAHERSAFVLFSESPRIIINWDDGRGTDTHQYLKEVKADGKTALHDSVVWVSRTLFKDKTGKNVVILVTDGIDTVSRASFQEMMRATREAGVTLYPIIYTNHYIENYRRSLLRTGGRQSRTNVSRYFHGFVKAQNDFLEESMRYGGRVIFSEGFSDLDRIYQDVIQEMKSHYVMLYKSDMEMDSREVRVYTDRVPGKIFIDIRK